MGNIVKIKLAISVFSVAALVLIPLLKSNFNERVIIKRWSALTWEDFRGMVPPFTRYDAAVSSDVLIELDSATSRYRAYAVQNNVESWTREHTGQEDLLRHEQYHFNISEIFARKLNEYIDANPDETDATLYNLRLNSLNLDLDAMQDQYDRETVHGTQWDQQKRWEYKIDSLLQSYTPDTGWVTDYYSGATAYFPDKPELTSGLNENQIPFRNYRLNKYEMHMSLYSYHYGTCNAATAAKILEMHYLQSSYKNGTFRLDTLANPINATGTSEDSLGSVYRDVWIFQTPYICKLTAVYPAQSDALGGYSQMANSFLTSFKIRNTDAYWMAKYENSDPEVSYNTTTKSVHPKRRDFTQCFFHTQDVKNGFYRGPFYRSDGALFLVYNIVAHPDSLLHQNVLLLDKGVFISEPDHEDNIYFIPADRIPKHPFKFDFGYLLKKDSAARCYEYFYESIHVNP